MNTRKKLESKRSADDHNDRPIKTEKSYDRARGFERARSNASYSNDDEGHSFDKEYNFEKYAHKSPRGQNGRRSDKKAKHSPNSRFDTSLERHEEDVHEQTWKDPQKQYQTDEGIDYIVYVSKFFVIKNDIWIILQ